MWPMTAGLKCIYGMKVVKAYEEFLNEPIQQLDNQEFTVATLDREQDPTTSSPNVEEGQAEQRSENPVEADEALSPDNLVSVDLPGQGSGSTMEGTEIWESDFNVSHQKQRSASHNFRQVIMEPISNRTALTWTLARLRQLLRRVTRTSSGLLKRQLR